MSSLVMASPASASLASVAPTVSRQQTPAPQWHVRLPPSALLMPLVWLVASASLDTPAAQPLLAPRLTGVPVHNASMETVPTVVQTSPAPAHLVGKVPPAKRTWQSVLPTHASMGAPALNWLVASPAAVLLVGLDSHANGTLMSVPVILAGVHKTDIRVYFTFAQILTPFCSGMECAVTLLAPTCVLATLVGAAETAT